MPPTALGALPRRRVLAACALAASLLASRAFAVVTLTNLGTLAFTGAHGNGVSTAGAVSVGDYTDFAGGIVPRAFRWTSAGGMVDIGTLGGVQSSAFAVTPDGSVITGQAYTVGSVHTANGVARAFRWTSAGMQDLGSMGWAHSGGRAINADGSAITGSVGTPNATMTHAFRWTSTGGMQDLNTLGGTSSLGLGISADGSVVVGSADTADGATRAFRWTSGAGMQDLGVIGGQNSVAHAVSASGLVVVGQSDGLFSPQTRAFRWTPAGMQNLGSLGGYASVATAVSADGLIVAGESYLSNNTTQRAFLWSSATGMLDLHTYLQSLGVNLNQWNLPNIAAISPDGTSIIGTGSLGNATVAYLVTGLPVIPAPGASLALALGGVLCARRRRRS